MSSEQEPSEGQITGKSRLARLRIAVLVTLIAFLAGAAAWPLVAPYLAGYLPAGFLPAYLDRADDHLTGVRSRLAALEARLGQVERARAEPVNGEIAGAMASLENAQFEDAARLAVIEDRLSRLESAAPATGTAALRVPPPPESPGGPGTAERLAELDQRLTVLEARPAASSDASAALAFALARLERALAGGGSYAGELDRVQELIDRLSDAKGGGGILGATGELRKWAATGVVPLPELRQRFSGLARDVLRARRPPPDAGWTDRALAALSGLVTVRRTGARPGGGAESILARAEAALAAGDLEAAVRELAALGEPELAAAEPWLDDAQDRLAAGRALALLEAAAARSTAP